MTLPPGPTTLFGVPLALSRRDALELTAGLRDLWAGQASRVPGDLDEDLELLRRYFDPIASGERLRKAVAQLPKRERRASPPLMTPLLVQKTNDGRELVTPEGRLTLACLDAALELGDGETVVIEPAWVHSAEHVLVERYRDWGRQRLNSVLKLRAGKASPMHPTAVALVLLLLINRSTSEDRAIRRPTQSKSLELVDEALRGAQRAFADVLRPGGRRRDEHLSLYIGYPLTEARRRLSDSLSEPDCLFIRPDHEDRVLDFLAQDVANRKRPPSVYDLGRAFDALVAAYRQKLPALASLGLAFERPSYTEQLRTRLLEAYQGHVG